MNVIVCNEYDLVDYNPMITITITITITFITIMIMIMLKWCNITINDDGNESHGRVDRMDELHGHNNRTISAYGFCVVVGNSHTIRIAVRPMSGAG